MRKTKNWAGYFFPLQTGWHTKHQTFVKSKDTHNHHLGNIPNATVKATAWETPWKKSRSATSLFFPFPTAACCCESIAWAALLDASGLCQGQMFWHFPRCSGKAEVLAVPGPACITAHTLPPTQPSRILVCFMSAEMLVSSHMEMASVHTLGWF